MDLLYVPLKLRTEIKRFLVRERAGHFRTLFVEGKLETYAVTTSDYSILCGNYVMQKCCQIYQVVVIRSAMRQEC